jgi:hypothetical protein
LVERHWRRGKHLKVGGMEGEVLSNQIALNAKFKKKNTKAVDAMIPLFPSYCRGSKTPE